MTYFVDVWKHPGVYILESQIMPEKWRTNVLVQIFKNRVDLYSFSNYTGIKIMSHTMKICESNTDVRFALRVLMERRSQGNVSLWI